MVGIKLVGWYVTNAVTLGAVFFNQRGYCSAARHASAFYNSTSTSIMSDKRLLLPQNVKPLHYDLTMHPDLDNYTYTGSVGIDLQVNEDSNSISLNTLDLELSNIKLGNGEKVKEHNYDKDSETSTFVFENGIKKGENVTLNIDFKGELNDKLCGFYRSVHTDDNGKTRVVATTQMEPTDARRAFPCFDEPALKATFDVHLVHKKGLTALSNGSQKNVTNLENDLEKTSFNTSPLMSTYLLAFIVGDLAYVESNAFRVPVRVYATPGMEQKGQFGADLVAKCLAFYEKEFDMPYPLDKMDMVAIHDFSAGAMENWGLITYRVVDLLFDEKTESAATMARVSEVLLHETAHQWFGNLVTMEWWEGLWLNEGFATWMSWYACNHFFPEWRVWETYVTDTLQSSFRLDGLRSSHPVEVPIERADEINQIFDAISYSKGSTIIKMTANWLGEETFIKGISLYLKRHKYGNTKTSDLWAALSEVSGKDVQSYMGVWTLKQGYPVVRVEERNGGDEVTAKQNRFLTTGDVKPEEDESIFPLDLALETKLGTSEIMMQTREKSFTADQQFYKLNANQTGLYRVLYPKERINKLAEAGANGLLSNEDRIGLVADVSALSSSGYQKTSAVLELLNGWKSEDEGNVWSEMISALGSIRGTWKAQPEQVRDALKKFQGDLTGTKCKEVGFSFNSTDGLLEQQKKALLFGSCLGADVPEFKQAAMEMFKKYLDGDSEAINPNLRSAVFTSAVKDWESADIFDKMMKIYLNPKSAAEGNTALRSIGRNKNQEVREKLLKASLEGPVRSQDVIYALVSLTIDVEGSKLLWDWMRNNFDAIYAKFPPATGMFGHIVESCAGSMPTKQRLNEIDEFFSTKDTKGYGKSINILKDRIQSRVSWLERDVDDVNEWLKANDYL